MLSLKGSKAQSLKELLCDSRRCLCAFAALWLCGSAALLSAAPIALLSSPPMPLIRCPKCGQAYDVPGVIAVRLPNSIATCTCGEWLSGSKAAVLARLVDASEIREVDLRPYRVDAASEAPAPSQSNAPEPAARPRC